MNATLPRQNNNLVPLLVLLALAAGAMLITTVVSHADTRHPGTADIVRQSCESGNQMTFRRMDQDYDYAAKCGMRPDGKWALQIFIKDGLHWVELTAFSPAVGQTVNEIVEYMIGTGWVLSWSK